MADKLVLTGYDLIKGATTKDNKLGFMNMTPFQMIPLEEKNEEWIKWNADFYESLGYRHVRKYARKQIKNRWLAAGILDHNDYLLSPEYNNFSELVGIVQGKSDEFQSPLEQFYPVIPNIIEVLKGEFLKRDNEVIIKGVDEFSISEALKTKEDQLQQILLQQQLQDKQAALAKMGILGDSKDPKIQQQFQQEMQQAQQIAGVQAKFKTYRSIAEQWAQHVLNVDRESKHLDELEVEQFTESLINAREFWHIDLKEDNYQLSAIDGAYAFYHMSDKVTYVGDGDYFGWFEWNTVGDIINSLGTELTDIQLEGLKSLVSNNMGAKFVPDMWKGFPGMYYDTTKKWPEGGRVDAALNDAVLERNLKDQYTNMSLLPVEEMLKQNSIDPLQPQMFRVMYLYWRSQRRVGFLTKRNRQGEITYADWVDENFKVTVDPEYDNSLIKSKTKYNLIYGEHVDWTYVNDWRRVVKINSNMANSFWSQNTLGFNPIYLDGKPTKFQFKGDTNPYESRPPVEGRVFKQKGVRPTSLVDRVKPWQIIANICNNKIPHLISLDPGIVLAIQKGMYPRNTGGKEAVDPKRQMLDNMREDKIIEFEVSKESLELPGQAALPSRVDLSLMDEAMKYANLGKFAKEQALESVGINMQRLGETKASETLGGNQTAISYSETQTESLFNQHSNELMPRVVARMIEAAQFFCSTKESSRIYYMNSQEENVWIEIEGTKSLPRHYHIYPTNKPKIKKMLADLKQLILQDNTMGATLLDKARGILTPSIPQYIKQLEEAQENVENRENQQFQQQQQLEQQKLEQAAQLQKDAQNFQDYELHEKLASDQKIAMIRALGGVQTDNNKDGQIDASQNLAIYQKAQDANNKYQTEQQKIQQSQDEFQQTLQLEREKLLSKEKIEQMKDKTALKNKTSSGY
jgi:hypothetical protein